MTTAIELPKDVTPSFVSAQNDKVQTPIITREMRLPSNASFDASKHLCFQKPAKRYTMADLGYDLDTGISPIAVTEPFPLFTKDAIMELRRDVLSDHLHDQYSMSTDLIPFQLREFNSKVAPFTIASFSSPEITAIVSECAGIELVPIMELELGHTNMQLPLQGGKAALRELPVEPSPPLPPLSSEEIAKLPNDLTGQQVANWHYDSYPFVLVVMLSDVSTMVGGETACRCADGSIKRVRGPQMGYATVLQGRHVEHLACRAFNSNERITMVTSYRAKDALVKDASVLSTIRICSVKERLNYQWALYRMKLLAERFQKYAEVIEAKRGQIEADLWPNVVEKDDIEKWCQEQIRYLETTYEEMM